MAKKTLITNDIIKLVQSSSDVNIVPFDTNKHLNIKIGRILISKGVGADPVLNLDIGVDKEYMELWNNDIGRIFLRELKKRPQNIYELKDEKFNALLVLANEADYDSLKSRGFLHVKFGDNRYTIIKVVKSGETYINNDSRNDYYSSFSADDIIEQPISEEQDDINIVETELF